MRKLVVLAAAMLLTACQANRTVYAPNDVSRATGRIEPIADLFKDEKIKRVRVVFVHGVNDHCPGYAVPLGEGEKLEQVARTAWLNEDAANLVGLRPRTGTAPFGGTTDARTFMQEGSRNQPAVRYRVREYDWAKRSIIFEAIEITWAPLTQSIKSNWLGYDAPSVMEKTIKSEGKVEHEDCVPDPVADVPRIARPLPRVAINETLKESTLDRALADAVIYVGSYGTVISHGVADALCHAITRDNKNQKCEWPRAPIGDEEATRYVFVTHSLGSRIVFDIFRDLIWTADEEAKATDDPKVYRPGRFSPEERKAASPFVSWMLARTPALYMMANQLPMLGLANIRDANLTLGPLDVPDETAKQRRLSGLEAIAQLRIKHDNRLPTMQVTAFHDTNDLLTWPLPLWYATETNGDPITFTNVYVKNAFRWLWVFEHPGDAHVGYFSNKEVWRAISCGAADGRIRDC